MHENDTPNPPAAVLRLLAKIAANGNEHLPDWQIAALPADEAREYAAQARAFLADPEPRAMTAMLAMLTDDSSILAIYEHHADEARRVIAAVEARAHAPAVPGRPTVYLN